PGGCRGRLDVRRSALLSRGRRRPGGLADDRPRTWSDSARAARATAKRRPRQVSADWDLRTESRIDRALRRGHATMSDPDNEAFEHYEDPGRREPAAGRARRRPDRAPTEHVPVRFPAAAIEVVR